jgi:acyl-CoA synthetase (NDP forming)
MNNVKPEVITSRVYEALLKDPNVEGIFNMMFCSRQFKAMNNIDNIIANAKQTSKPIFFWLIGEAKEVGRISLKLAKHHLPNFPSLEEMVKNFSILVQKSKNINLS